MVCFLLSPLSHPLIQRGTSPSGLSTVQPMPLSLPLSLFMCIFFFFLVEKMIVHGIRLIVDSLGLKVCFFTNLLFFSLGIKVFIEENNFICGISLIFFFSLGIKGFFFFFFLGRRRPGGGGLGLK